MEADRTSAPQSPGESAGVPSHSCLVLQPTKYQLSCERTVLHHEACLYEAHRLCPRMRLHACFILGTDHDEGYLLERHISGTIQGVDNQYDLL